MKELIVGSRDSALAVAQTQLAIEQIEQCHPEVKIRLVTLKTTGDKILDRELYDIGGKGLFVKELDRALLDGRIDLAVHSLKDMPMEENPALPIGAVLQRGDPRDVMVFPEQGTAEDYSRVGTSSQRRKLQLSLLERSAGYAFVRGNIHTRLRKLEEGQCSALILAAAGLERVGLAGRIGRYFAPEEMIPAAGQGILAIQTRTDFDAAFLAGVNHPDTMAAALAERSFVRSLGGGCSSPVAAYATVAGEEMELMGFYYDEEQQETRRDVISGRKQDGRRLGELLAERMRKR